MSPTPSGPPPSGPPSGSPSGPPTSGGSPGGPPSGPPRGSAAGGTPPSNQGFQLNRNQLIAIVAIVAILLGVLAGVLIAGGGGTQASKKERTIKLEPIASKSDAPFTPPLSSDTTNTPPPTILPPPTAPPGQRAQTPFGGTGNNSLCDREGLISFLTDPANAAQGREWARIEGISVADIPTFVRSLIPTVLRYDTRVTNHTFANGRAVALQSVLQAGTAVLVNQYGKPVARCRCGNPLLQPTEIGDPIYTGPKWPGFDPGKIIVIVVTQTPIYPPGGATETPDWTLQVDAQGKNVRRTQDSTVDVKWRGTFRVSGNTLSGTGTGTIEFNGGCYDLSTGNKISAQHTAATFDVQISGTASGDVGSRKYALQFTATNFQVTDFGVAACRSATTSDAFQQGTTEVFDAVELPGQNGTKDFNRGEYQGTYTLTSAPTTS